MKLQFIGAAQTVTGSMHYLSINGTKILLDCGLYQGKRKETFERNRTFDYFNPKEIDVVVLSHAHIDHAGNLPNLVKSGFDGKIYSTFATKDLCSLMLQDSAYIQEKDVEFVNKKRKRDKKNLFEPLYTQKDVQKTMRLFNAVNYHRTAEIAPGVELRFYDAGHILGSAVSHLTIVENGVKKTIAFSGDLGRPNLPIIRDPEKTPQADYFICESTYGSRYHDNFENTEAKLVEVCKRAIDRKAKIIVPAFSVGRTQEFVFLLNQIFDKGLLPRFPIFVDSPLSTNATQVFRMHPECFDLATSEYLVDQKDPFGFNKLTYITDVEDSKELNSVTGPCMIISSSGMAEAGRILHHLANNIENPKAMILIIGYCAEHTLGKRLVERQPEIRIFGDTYQLKAEVVVFNSLSAHADGNELLAYCHNFDAKILKGMFLVHGDFDQQEKFKTHLLAEGFTNISIPAQGEVFEL